MSRVTYSIETSHSYSPEWPTFQQPGNLHRMRNFCPSYPLACPKTENSWGNDSFISDIKGTGKKYPCNQTELTFNPTSLGKLLSLSALVDKNRHSTNHFWGLYGDKMTEQGQNIWNLEHSKDSYVSMGLEV